MGYCHTKDKGTGEIAAAVCTQPDWVVACRFQAKHEHQEQEVRLLLLTQQPLG